MIEAILIFGMGAGVGAAATYWKLSTRVRWLESYRHYMNATNQKLSGSNARLRAQVELLEKP